MATLEQLGKKIGDIAIQNGKNLKFSELSEVVTKVAEALGGEAGSLVIEQSQLEAIVDKVKASVQQGKGSVANRKMLAEVTLIQEIIEHGSCKIGDAATKLSAAFKGTGAKEAVAEVVAKSMQSKGIKAVGGLTNAVKGVLVDLKLVGGMTAPGILGQSLEKLKPEAPVKPVIEPSAGKPADKPASGKPAPNAAGEAGKAEEAASGIMGWLRPEGKLAYGRVAGVAAAAIAAGFALKYALGGKGKEEGQEVGA